MLNLLNRPARPLMIALTLSAAAVAQVLPTPTSPPPTMAPMLPASRPSTGPASQPGDEAAVRAALTAYNAAVAAGDTAALQGFVVVSTDTQRRAMTLMGRLTTAGRGVYGAAVEAFGEKALATENVDRQSFPSGFPALPLDGIDIKPEGDRAALVIRSSAEAPPLSMKRVDGTWKLDGDALLPPMTDKQLADQTSVLDSAIGAIEQTAADVKAGHFHAPDEVIVLMNHRVQKAVRAAQAKLAPVDAMTMPPQSGPTTGPATAPTQLP